MTSTVPTLRHERILMREGARLVIGMDEVGRGALAGPVGNANGILIPAPRRGIILYTVRDAISRDPLTTDLASGFKEVLAELATIGYRQIEFAGFTQHANSEGGSNLNTVEGATLLRSWLDANGLEAEGNHGSVPSTVTDATIAQFDTACEIANILGMGHIGTGNDPTSSAFVADWEAAAERWNFFGERATSHGLKLYTHNHDVAYSFLLDSGPLDALGRPTRSSGTRRLEHFLAHTDPKHVYLEMDIYWAHVAQYKHHTYTAPDGGEVTGTQRRRPAWRLVVGSPADPDRCRSVRVARAKAAGCR
jgi:sugar phosphate isomerase/epimerase